jgi:hypothetical protein
MGNRDYHPQALQLSAEQMPLGWELVASSRHARVARNAAGTLYYKEFLPRGPLESLKALARGSRATRARYHNEALRHSGFDAPTNVAWGKLPRGREYLFSHSVPGRGVADWLLLELGERQGERLALRRQLLHQLGTFVGRFHAAGFLHGDLRASNVLAELREGNFRFALIDNERNSRQTDAPARGMLRNLMQLNMLPPADLSARDRMRFFTAWRNQLPALSQLEARVLGVEAYHWAIRRLQEKGKL